METELAPSSLNLAIVEEEFPSTPDSIYLNAGSNGRKPASVLAAINEGWQRLNINPTLTTFKDPEPWQLARQSAADVLNVPPRSLLITQSTTQGLQLIMQTFLRKPGDELVTTNHEHGSLNTIVRYLEETRGVVVRRCEVRPESGSGAFCLSVLDQVTERTKLVAISEISCYTGWRPDLSSLTEALSLLDVPFLVDGAHVPGQVWVEPARYPLWVGSGHKWLGAPNGTGFAYIAPSLVPLLEPVWLGDWYFDRKDADIEDLTRFEAIGTADVVRLYGLARACHLYKELGADNVARRQFALVDYLRQRLSEEFNPVIRTPVAEDQLQKTAMLTCNFPAHRLKVDDLREALWQKHRIWVQPDFLNENPGRGMRVSCHYSVRESDIEALITALKTMVSP